MIELCLADAGAQELAVAFIDLHHATMFTLIYFGALASFCQNVVHIAVKVQSTQKYDLYFLAAIKTKSGGGRR
jgi:hypothetical protein